MGSTNAQGGDGAATPAVQGNSKPELAITAAIRKSIQHDSSLSMTAKDVKVITAGTKVTLRGHVHSATERATIESYARQTVGVTDIDDQIQVKAQ
jgi:osmotically-inducible protein OsmY